MHYVQIIGPAVVGFGLLGNILNLIVLTRPSMKGVTYTYLIWLAFSDTGVLLCAVAMMVSCLNISLSFPSQVTTTMQTKLGNS